MAIFYAIAGQANGLAARRPCRPDVDRRAMSSSFAALDHALTGRVH
jgi:hypothetical protein